MSGANVIVEYANMLRSFRSRLDVSAQQIAQAVEQAVKETASRGVAPTGVPWAPRKDGGAPLTSAADKIQVEYRKIGNSHYIYVRVKGHYALHDLGRARGAIRRQILPDQISPELTERIQTILEGLISAR